MEIKKGSIVYLKSGSPAMTLGELYTTGAYKCAWFVSDEYKEAYFALDQLTGTNPKPSIPTSAIDDILKSRNSY